MTTTRLQDIDVVLFLIIHHCVEFHLFIIRM